MSNIRWFSVTTTRYAATYLRFVIRRVTNMTLEEESHSGWRLPRRIARPNCASIIEILRWLFRYSTLFLLRRRMPARHTLLWRAPHVSEAALTILRRLRWRVTHDYLLDGGYYYLLLIAANIASFALHYRLFAGDSFERHDAPLERVVFAPFASSYEFITGAYATKRLWYKHIIALALPERDVSVAFTLSRFR